MSDPTKAIEGSVQSGMPRVRTCCRCERIADDAEKSGLPRPPVNECQSWTTMGRRYWSGTCSACAARERQQREDARYAQKQENRR